MPKRTPKICNVTGCPKLSRDGSGYCKDHVHLKAAAKKSYEKTRETATARGYTHRWRKASKAYLARNPLCVKCQEFGNVTPATVTDHIVPHKGDADLFWNPGNWQALCKRCHNIKTATEDGGFGRWYESDERTQKKSYFEHQTRLGLVRRNIRRLNLVYF